jgi:hypothetical protein
VRLYELGGAQLPDGRRIDARDAVWVIDCERKLGAVAYEKAFADPSIAAVDRLAFGQAAGGSMQARFGDALCVTNPDVQ